MEFLKSFNKCLLKGKLLQYLMDCSINENLEEASKLDWDAAMQRGERVSIQQYIQNIVKDL